MNSIYLTSSMLRELFNDGEYYYLKGECGELMSLRRLLDYADYIVSNNSQEDSFPQRLNKNICLVEDAEEVIKWFGEEVSRVLPPTNSIDFIKE